MEGTYFRSKIPILTSCTRVPQEQCFYICMPWPLKTFPACQKTVVGTDNNRSRSKLTCERELISRCWAKFKCFPSRGFLGMFCWNICIFTRQLSKCSNVSHVSSRSVQPIYRIRHCTTPLTLLPLTISLTSQISSSASSMSCGFSCLLNALRSVV